ncbi:MAG: SAM-dependent methyltransferase [Candidatus Cryptobacteroides sp.]
MIPAPVLELLHHIDRYVVEEERTVRRYLSRAGLKGHIEELDFTVLNEHTSPEEVEKMLSLFEDGKDVGLISEAGLPAVADPGAALVALCHRHEIEVCPLVGPSSLMLALMGSGLDGQSFAFRGYLPAKSEQRKAAIKEAERLSGTLRQTQIFIETPYRSDALFQDFLNCLAPATRLCVAKRLCSDDQYIKTYKVSKWKNRKLLIGKEPCVFLILK